MSVLSIHNLEKQEKDVLLFPSFNLDIGEQEVVAIHSSLNIREALLHIILGKISSSSGEIFMLGEKVSKEKNLYDMQIGICFFENGYYTRLTVEDHVRFYMRLYNSQKSMEEILSIVQLNSFKNKKISKLSFSEKRRLSFAYALCQGSVLFIFEEPDLNVDMETKRVFLNIIQQLKKEQKSVLVLTSNMESAITMGDHVYRLTTDGLFPVEIEEETGAVNDVEEKDEKVEEVIPITSNFNKIPTKVNDKIILFDPPEIDYIESNEGQSNVYIKGEAFPSTFTMNELEERLQPFGFFRCHRSYIVNLQKVREVITWTRNSYSLVLEDKPKSTIPLSKSKMTQLKDMLGLK
jgi:ABC-2 type transport system ATP-binding protein